MHMDDVEHANSVLDFIKKNFRIGEDRFNALELLYIHKSIQIFLLKIIDLFGSMVSKRFRLINKSK